ncbi:hypothetical protein ETP66_08850 [Thermus thermamylovorans]|uniref:3D domain-containing protein n=1 Tax=Thermus thermamylovorans TaxID=2509362 RepID=A0A4Q9AZG2_9DEIN|nr:hypothetical protein ETP66_08850 [Thermus thermamylovorans]
MLLFALALFQAVAQSSGRRVMVLEATAYTSSPRETWGNPFVTATGTRTRIGVLAVSRDLLGVLPYGTRVRLRDLGTVHGRGKGQFDPFFREVVFVVEDTMNARWRNRVDVWMPDRATALRFGRRLVELEVVELPQR